MFSFTSLQITALLATLTQLAGNLEAIIHQGIEETSQFEEYTENLLNWSAFLYRCPHVELAIAAHRPQRIGDLRGERDLPRRKLSSRQRQAR